MITLFARSSIFPVPPAAASTSFWRLWGSGDKSRAPLSNSQLSCRPDTVPEIEITRISVRQSLSFSVEKYEQTRSKWLNECVPLKSLTINKEKEEMPKVSIIYLQQCQKFSSIKQNNQTFHFLLLESRVTRIYVCRRRRLYARNGNACCNISGCHFQFIHRSRDILFGYTRSEYYKCYAVFPRSSRIHCSIDHQSRANSLLMHPDTRHARDIACVIISVTEYSTVYTLCIFW